MYALPASSGEYVSQWSNGNVRGLSHWKGVALTGIGHNIPQEAPAAFAAALSRLLG